MFRVLMNPDLGKETIENNIFAPPLTDLGEVNEVNQRRTRFRPDFAYLINFYRPLTLESAYGTRLIGYDKEGKDFCYGADMFDYAIPSLVASKLAPYTIDPSREDQLIYYENQEEIKAILAPMRIGLYQVAKAGYFIDAIYSARVGCRRDPTRKRQFKWKTIFDMLVTSQSEETSGEKLSRGDFVSEIRLVNSVQGVYNPLLRIVERSERFYFDVREEHLLPEYIGDRSGGIGITTANNASLLLLNNYDPLRSHKRYGSIPASGI